MLLSLQKRQRKDKEKGKGTTIRHTTAPTYTSQQHYTRTIQHCKRIQPKKA